MESGSGIFLGSGLERDRILSQKAKENCFNPQYNHFILHKDI
jgi:hypothetical protein